MVAILEIIKTMACNITSGDDPLSKLCDLWKLHGQRVRSINIHLEVDNVARITIVRYMDTEEAEQINAIMQEYVLWKEVK